MGRDQRIRLKSVHHHIDIYIHRPLNLLYPLECPDNTDNEDNQVCNNEGDQLVSTAKIADGNEHREESEEDDMSDDVCDDLMETSDTLSKRKATLVARMKIKNWLNPEESVADCKYDVTDDIN